MSSQNSPGVASADFPGDILADERVRRRSSKLRFIGLLSPWGRRAEPMPGSIKFLLLVAMVSIMVVGVWITRDVYIDQARGMVARAPIFPDIAEGPHPDAGRSLEGHEYSLASQYGDPLDLGEGGRPVVRFEDGDVRELTELEVEWDSPIPFRPTGLNNMVFGPGPRGFGLWFDEQLPDGSPDYVYNRIRWAERQEFELSRAVGLVADGMKLYVSVDSDNFSTEPTLGLEKVITELERSNRHTFKDRWQHAPEYWGCSAELERDLHFGLTAGCPGGQLVEDLERAWLLVGEVSQLFRRMVETTLFMSVYSRSDWAYAGVHESLLQQREEMQRQLLSLDSVLTSLRSRGAELKLPMEVYFFQ